MDYEAIRHELDGPVLLVTLNRPEKLNAYTARMGAELADALGRADADDAVRAVILTGEGGAYLEKRPPAFPGKVSTDMPAGYPWWTGAA